MQSPPLDPDVADIAPTERALTPYDHEHAITYLLCQIAFNCDPPFASNSDPETGGAEPHIAEQSRSWRAASGEREVMRGS
jgi:hypothetical protein